MKHYQTFVGGEFVDGQSSFETRDPGTGMVFATVSEVGPEQVDQAVREARRSFDAGVWSDLPPAERAAAVMELADLVWRNGAEIAALESRDSGRMASGARADVWLGARTMKNIAHHALTRYPWREAVEYDGMAATLPSHRHLVVREPIGVCVGIIPWNFPFTMATWKLTMALLTGNSIVLKPAAETPVSALSLARLIAQTRIPKGVVSIIPGGPTTGEMLCRHGEVDKIAFTGSTEVGKKILAMAADRVANVTLELGGKSANIILEDADMEAAVDGALFASLMHCGQICASGTRLLVPDRIYDEFVRKMTDRVADIRVTHQSDPTGNLGPINNPAQLAKIEQYVAFGHEAGAKLLAGGKRPTVEGCPEGWYFAPTIFGDVTNDMRIAREEIFGPVLSVIRYQDVDDAVALANDSDYGLAGGVWSRDINKAKDVAGRIRTGTIWINDYHMIPDLCPFGGYKQSGLGRELGHWGLDEYVHVKHISTCAELNPAHKLPFRVMLPYDEPLGFEFLGPTRIVCGRGRISKAPHEVQRLGGQRAFVISDRGIDGTEIHRDVIQALGELYAGSFIDVPQDSSLETIDRAAHAAREANADVIVSVGGGSVIDTAKATCVCLTEGGSISEHLFGWALTRPQTPHVTIPTTAGTGSEVTSLSVIHNAKLGNKIILVDNFIIPNVAILDPNLTKSMPPQVAASTAMDALTHAIEAACSIKRNAFTDAHAMASIRLLKRHLPAVVASPDDSDARLHVQVASTLAGFAIGVAGTGLAHALSHALGAVTRIPHGTANGILLPHVLRFNSSSPATPLQSIADALGLDVRRLADDALGADTAEEVTRLLHLLNHPLKLRDAGVSQDSLQQCAELAQNDASLTNNPRPIRALEELRRVLEEAW